MTPVNMTSAEPGGNYFPITDLYHNHLLHNVALENAA